MRTRVKSRGVKGRGVKSRGVKGRMEKSKGYIPLGAPFTTAL